MFLCVVGVFVCVGCLGCVCGCVCGVVCVLCVYARCVCFVCIILCVSYGVFVCGLCGVVCFVGD